MQQRYTWRDFLPLGMVVLGVVLLTGIVAHYHHAHTMHDFMRYGMASFFIVFGLFKLINLRAFATAYQEYDLVAKAWPLYAFLYPGIELLLGIAYYYNWYPMIIQSLTLGIMLVSAAGVYQALQKKEMIMCACLGALFKIPMTYVTLGEDLLMAAMAAYMLVA